MVTINDFLASEEMTLRDVLKVIDANAHGACFVTDTNGRLTGVITDGDARRALLSGCALEDKAGTVKSPHYVSYSVTESPEKIYNTLSSRIKIIPLVDENGVPVDYASYSKLHRTPIMQPLLDGNELAYVSDCIKTGWISSQGAYVKRFEKEFAEFCGAKYAVAVSNGTVALHLALAALGIKEGDEVIVPDLTFAASINAVIYTGAIPVIVDIDRTTWTISVEEIEKNITPRTKAIMPVHLYGHPCHMDEIAALAAKHKLLVIEDAAEAIGSKYKNRHVGTFGDAATFSFFGNKTILTAEGGMAFFKDEAAYHKATVLRDHGMSKNKKYWHEEVGFNYRMTNLQAAVGCAQMERIDQFVGAKRALAEKYNSLLTACGLFELPPQESWARCGFWLYTAVLKNTDERGRDELINKLLKNGVETRPVFYPLHVMPPYKKYNSKSNFLNSKLISAQGISFPSSVNITEEEIVNIERALLQILRISENQNG